MASLKEFEKKNLKKKKIRRLKLPSIQRVPWVGLQFVVFPDHTHLLFNSLPTGNTIRVSNSLDPDQARHYVGPGLGPNCLQRLSTEDTSR